jgi:hypothetical protein
MSQSLKSFIEGVADRLVAFGELQGDRFKQPTDATFRDRHNRSDNPLQSLGVSGGKRPQKGPLRIGPKDRVRAPDIDRNGVHGVVVGGDQTVDTITLFCGNVGRFIVRQPTVSGNGGSTELWVGEARAQLCRATPFASLA